MKSYRVRLNNGDFLRFSFSTNFDNIINRYRGKEVVEGAFLMDCGIVYIMPRILRYCFEQNVELASKFLRDLPSEEAESGLTTRWNYDFNTPLREDIGTVRKISDKLAIFSAPEKYFKTGRVLLDSIDVAPFIEGIVRALDCDGVRGGRSTCIQAIRHYQSRLENGLILS
jgi:hypothetical protein